MAYYRVMSLISFDLRNHPLSFDPEVHRQDPLAWLSKKEVQLLHKLSQNSDEELLPEAAAEAKARFGTANVKRLSSIDVCGGLFWKCTLLAADEFCYAVDSVAHMIPGAWASPRL